MNLTVSCGRLTDEPKITYLNSGKAKAEFNLALNRVKEGADFPRFVAWEKQAEFIEKWCHKGTKLLITGHIQTGSYEGKNGKVYTTDIIVDRAEFVEKKGDDQPKQNPEDKFLIPEGIDEELPFK